MGIREQIQHSFIACLCQYAWFSNNYDGSETVFIDDEIVKNLFNAQKRFLLVMTTLGHRLVMCLTLLTASSLAAAPKVLILGDSQSEEYEFEAGPEPLFSSPESNLLESNIQNWVEILSDRRKSDIDFGEYKSDYLADFDIRNGGYAYNWSVPGFETTNFISVINPFSFNPLYQWSRPRIEDQLANTVDYAVIFLGGNDVRSRYGAFYDDTVSQSTLDDIVDRLEQLVDFVQDENGNVKIIVVNIPDVGITPSKIAAHTNATKRAIASATIAALNADIAAMAASKGAIIADVFSLTQDLREGGPSALFYINGTSFIKDGDPENPPLYLFARDGFHPTTAPQSLYANAIIAALNAHGESIAPLTMREILGNILGLNPDQPLVDYLASYGLPSALFTADADLDGRSNGIELALQTNPAIADSPALSTSIANATGGPQFVVHFQNANTANGYINFGAQSSSTLKAGEWANVPTADISPHTSGGIEVRVPFSGPRRFVRPKVSQAP